MEKKALRSFFRRAVLRRAISNFVMFILVFVWTVYLKPEAQVGPLKGKECVVFYGTVSLNRNSIQGKVRDIKEEFKIPHESILFIKKGYPHKIRAGR